MVLSFLMNLLAFASGKFAFSEEDMFVSVKSSSFGTSFIKTEKFF